MSREDLGRRQAALVAALVGGEPIPAGFDEQRVRATADVLIAKRAGEVAAQWPMLRLHFGPHWIAELRRWSNGRPPQGSLRDGWDLARAHRVHLGPAARLELAEREVAWRYDGTTPPRRRRIAARIANDLVLVQAGGRVRRIGFGLPWRHE